MERQSFRQKMARSLSQPINNLLPVMSISNKSKANNNKNKVKLKNLQENDDFYSISSEIIDDDNNNSFSNSNQKEIMIPIKRSISTASNLKQKIKKIFPNDKNSNTNDTFDDDQLKFSIDNKNTLYQHNIDEPLINLIKDKNENGNETIKAKIRRLAMGLGTYFVTCGSSQSNRLKRRTKNRNIINDNEIYLEYTNHYVDNDPIRQPDELFSKSFNQQDDDSVNEAEVKAKKVSILSSLKTSPSIRSIKSMKKFRKNNKSWSLLESGSNNGLIETTN
jgi:hypothetical protein